MAKVEIKQPIVQEIAENIKDAQSVVLVDYRGLTVAQDTQLRKQLREAGITYKVYKNTLMNFAFKGTEFESLSDSLEGPNAIAISKDDATAPARVLAQFAKTAPALEIKAGVVEGNFYDTEAMKEISGIPSSWPGVVLTIGSSGSKVRQMQEQLNRIAQVYSSIPRITADGSFGPATQRAVRQFQSVFGLPQTGVVDYKTWYKISEIYVGVTRIAELN